MDRAAALPLREDRIAVSPASQTADKRAAAFEHLVEAHYVRVYNLAYRMLGNEGDAADVTQEAFLRAFRALPRLREGAAAGPWIRRIATNLSLDVLRRRRSGPFIASIDAPPPGGSGEGAGWDLIDPTGEPERALDQAESTRLLYRAVGSLPANYRIVIVLYHMECLPVEAIAETLGIPAGTVKSRLSRARRELKRKLSPYF
jgi:RNA polymerase sigma-70 factor (ECF subfamily)